MSDLIEELDIVVKLIPQSPDLGKTLQEKEEHYFNESDALVFLLTPGSSRKGTDYPSPSVADEMGQARQKFKNQPEKVIYLVDKACNIQVIDQKGYIAFDRTDMRSVLEAIVMLLKNLKAAGVWHRKKIEKREIPGIDIAEVSRTTDPRFKQVCLDLSEAPNGILFPQPFDKLLIEKYHLNQRDINFVKRDLQLTGLILFESTPQPYSYSYWRLSNLGFELVRYEIQSQNKTVAELIAELAKVKR
ncbi:MAG TPA: hypothetical protein VEG60_02820 [Candidatus Binatia bacterium]|nr:hypothetical protein [Candidatus Binatia bacterium]